MRILLFSYATLHIITIDASQPPVAQPAPKPKAEIPQPIQFIVHINNSQEAKSNNSTAVATTQVSKPKEVSQTPLFDKLNTLKQDMRIPQGIKDGIIGYPQNFFGTYKWHLLGASVVGTYAGVCALLAMGNSYLKQTDLWSSWHQELAMDQLLAIPQQQLSQELIHEIQRRYTEPSSLSDLVKPLSLFILATQKEEEQLQWYQSFYSWLSWLRITKVVPFSTTRFAQINQRLQRLIYYKNIFQSWTANYQLEHAKRSIRSQLTNPNQDLRAMHQLIATQQMDELEKLWGDQSQLNEIACCISI